MKEIIVFVHNHFDLMWLRRSEEYQEIQSDVILKVLRLLDMYPDYAFAFGQANIVRNFLEQYPNKKEKLLEFSAKGQLELVCGAEAIIDTNMVCPESLIRNIILGLEWYKESLGIKVKTGWLLDAFGLTPQIPQIMRKAGFEWMVGDRYPGRHIPNFYRWTGLDGTSILVGHASGGGVFGMNGPVFPWEKIRSVFKDSISNMSQKADISIACIYSEEGLPSKYFRELVEDIKDEFPELDIHWGTPCDFFRRIIELEKSKILQVPELKGEQQLPVSTGCYTTRIPVKLANRKAETALLTTEKITSAAAFSGISSNTCEMLDKAWRLLLLNQFHDGLCGCHTPQVSQEIMRRYEEIIEIAGKAVGSALLTTSKNSISLSTKNKKEQIWIFNPATFRYKATICAVNDSGTFLPDPLSHKNAVPVIIENAPPMSFFSFNPKTIKSTHKPTKPRSDSITMENKYYKLLLKDGNGLAGVRIKDGNTELSMPGNIMHLREDTGHMWLEDFSGAFTSSLEGKISITDFRQNKDSSIAALTGNINVPWSKNATLKFEQQIALYRDIPYIDFLTSMNWDGDNTQFQVRFPTNINVSHGYYNVPFGEVPRNEYDAGKSLGDNAWVNEDWPANQYFYVKSEDLYAGLINRGTSGASVRNGELRMTLMRTSTSAMGSGDKADDSLALRGKHVFRYAFMAWKGKSPWPIQQAAQIYNTPLVFFKGKPVIANRPSINSLIELLSQGVVITCVKPARDGNGIIIRGYESLGNKHECLIKLGCVCDAWQCDIMEKNIKSMGSALKSLGFRLSGFEIFTLRIKNSRK